jgi:glutaredoxin 2
MSKEIELEITVGKDGKIIVTPNGTQGSECLDVMKFLDKINGMKVLSTTPNQDMKDSSVKGINKVEVKQK